MQNVQIHLNGEVRRLPEGATVAMLLEELELDARQLAVEINQQLVPRTVHESTPLGDGDAVEIVTLVGGG